MAWTRGASVAESSSAQRTEKLFLRLSVFKHAWGFCRGKFRSLKHEKYEILL